MTLADHLDLRNLPLGTTPGGVNFSLKALHPSEHTIKTARVPSGNRMSVALACDMVETIPIATANSSMRIILSPNPLIPAAVQIQDGATNVHWNFYNSAFGGSANQRVDPGEMKTHMMNMLTGVESYRITSQSATVELIAPALSDQGTITAGQYTITPQTCECYTIDAAALHYYPDTWLYSLEDLKSSELTTGTKAYTAKARDGVYMPLHLTDVEHFQNMHDLVIYEDKARDPASYLVYNTVVDAEDFVVFPFNIDNTGFTPENMCPLPKMCGNNFGLIYVDGMAANVAVRIRVRQVVEITCVPGTVYSPLVEVALPPDPTAIKMYYEISSRMADAYPASYNDLGKLKDLIQSIGKKVLPYVEPALDVLSKLPGPVGAVASTVKQVAPVAKTIIRPLVKKKQSTASKK